MNKQEAIEKIEKEKSNLNAWEDLTRNRALNDALAIVRKIYEPEKSKVPNFVAEWIEYCKSNKLTLLGAFDPVSEHGIGLANTFTGEVWKCIDWAKRNQDTFAKAWLFGYEVEKEKLYTVELPNPHSYIDTHTRLARNYKGKVVLEVQDWLNTFESYKLTESEIKEDFEWAWQFAKEVEE